MKQIYEWIDKVWQWIAETVFLRFEFDLSHEELSPLVKEGRVIFTLTSGGMLEWLILSSWCRSRGLGAILVANRKRILLLAKPKYFFQLFFRRKSYCDLFLSSEDGPRLLFCPSREHKKPFVPTPAEILLCELYSKLAPQGKEAEVHFVPIYILWRKHLRGTTRAPSEYIFGLSSNPNLIGKMWYLFRARMDSTVRSLTRFTFLTKDPVESLAGVEESEAMRIAKSIRRKILILTQQEMRVVLGPRYHSPLEVKETLLRDPEIQALIEELAKTSGVDQRKLMAQAYANFSEIVANQTFRFIEVMYVLLTWLFTRVFDGLVSSDAEFQNVREIMKTKPVVFVPCHRSHLDYLVMPYVMFLNDMVPPHVAAGINLAFWPAGHFLRKGGAFFIRRSFRGDKLYTMCLKKYVEYLLKNRFNMKFFIEGTRSRSGKMLAPAYGMLKMTLEAYQRRVCDDIALIPVSFCYDEVPEQGSYSRELGGGQKVKESARQLIKSKEIIKRNFGKVYVRLAPAIYARDVFSDSEVEEKDKTLALQKTAFQLCKSINDVTPITPKSLVCSVLLSTRETAMSLEDILRLSEMLAAYVKGAGRPLSVEPGDLFKRAVEQIMRRLQKTAAVSVSEAVPRGYFCENRKRVMLNFYKNNAIHCLVMPSITLLAYLEALEAPGNDSAEKFKSLLIEKAIQLRNILKFEFFFSPTPLFVEEIDPILKQLVGEIPSNATSEILKTCLEEHFCSRGDIFIYTNLLGELIESYLFALQFIRQVGPGSSEKKSFLQRVLKHAEQKAQEGGVLFQESISTQNYSNALLLFENFKFVSVRREDEKSFVVLENWNSKMQDLEQTLQVYLNRMKEPLGQKQREEKVLLLGRS